MNALTPDDPLRDPGPMTPFEPIYPPLRWSRVSRRRYAAGVAALAVAMTAAWFASGEAWPVALRTVVLIQGMFLAWDGVRYVLWRRRRVDQGPTANHRSGPGRPTGP